MSQLKLMRSRRFAPIFWTQFLGAFNDNVFRFALIIFVTFTLAERTGMDTRTLVVLTGAIFILPFFVLSALAGQLADRYEKSRLIRQIKSAEIFVMAGGAVGFWLGSFPLLLLSLFLMGVQSTFFGPLKYGVLPQHLGEHELTGGNGLIQMGTYVAILIGGICGGLLAGFSADSPSMLIATVIGIAVLGRTAAAFIPEAPANAPALTLKLNPLTATWRLMRRDLGEREIATLIMLISTFWFVGASFLSIVPSYGKALLNANETAVTLLNAAFTIGIGGGSLACERLSRGRIEIGLVPVAAVVISLAALDVWLSGVPEFPPEVLTASAFFSNADALRFFIDLTLIGAAGALYIVPLYAALQARADAARCSRTLAALNVMNALFMVISAVLTMLLFHAGWRIPEVFALIALINLAAMAFGVLALPEFSARVKQLFVS